MPPWSSYRLAPLPVHRRSTARVLSPSVVGFTVMFLPAARLCTGAVAVGVAATGVLATSGTDWSVVLAASSAKDRLACRWPATVGLKATLRVTLAPGATVPPLTPAGTVRVKSPGLRPAR